MSSETEERPLLHEPDLMLAVLRTSAGGRATLDDSIRHLRSLLRIAREPPPADLEELRARLGEVEAKLTRAGLIRPAGPGVFEITDRGRRMLEDHPDGVDESLLMRFAEYRAPAIEGSAGGLPESSAGAYDAGYAAWLAGRTLADNPHPPDRRDHLDWQNGWSQARDDVLRSGGADRDRE